MHSVMDERGQIVIPEDVREKLGLSPGSVVDFVMGDSATGEAVIRNRDQNHGVDADRFDRLRGSLNLGMTTDEFMALMRGDD